MIEDQKKIEEKYEFESFYIFALLFKNKWVIITGTLVGIIASVIIALMLPNWYKSTTNVVPPNDDETGLGSAISGISSALKEFGLTKLGGQGGEAYTYLVILESRTVKDSMIKKYELHKTYDIPDTNLIELRKEFEGNLDITYEKEGNYTISIWDKDANRAAIMANDYVQIANALAVRIARQEAKMNTEYLEKRIGKIDSTIDVLSNDLEKYSEKYMLFSFDEQAKAIASAYAEMKAQEMQYDIMYDMYKNTYGANDPMTQDLKSIKDGWTQK
jgi:tyrosine-protein kinase Etk/Wzc